MKRMFIPLNSEPFYWFRDGLKKFELRNQIGQYNKKQLIRGRDVELRRGYSTNDKLFGVLGEIYYFEKIEDVFEKINFKHIIPTALNIAQAIEFTRNTLKQKENFVLIEIKL